MPILKLKLKFFKLKKKQRNPEASFFGWEEMIPDGNLALPEGIKNLKNDTYLVKCFKISSYFLKVGKNF